MRQVMSTALVALIIGALAGATMGAVAQSEPAAERAIDTAGLNADKVDGRHAVKYTNQRSARRGRLVATNNKGELPSNIVRPFWGLVRNTPAGFADGVDDEGVTGITITKVAGPYISVAAGSTNTDTVSCPAGSVAIGGGMNGNKVVMEDSYPLAITDWFVRGTDAASVGGGGFSAWVVCMTVDPAVAIATASRGKIGPASTEK